MPLVSAKQDKATMEMESMEDGYIAKLLKAEGAQNITVGEVCLPRIAAGACDTLRACMLTPCSRHVCSRF